jgi:hypothetical protein
MANRFPLVGNSTTRRLEELKPGDNLNLEGCSVWDGTTSGSPGQVLKATVNGSVQWSDVITVEEIQDIVGEMVTGNTEININVQYDDTTGKLNFLASGGGGTGGTSLDGLSDVTITSPVNIGHVLRYNGTNFVNQRLAYSDLSGLPTIPAAQIQVDWNQTNISATDYIRNKPTIIAPVQSDWTQSDVNALDFIKNKPTIPPAYTLPTASPTVLGGIKIGNNLSIDANGVLSAAAGALPIASTTVLGGVKVDGTTITINAGGVISAIGGGGSGGGAANLNQLTDVAISNPFPGQVLRFDGTEFVNSRLSYPDLENLPTIPDPQVQSDWNAISGLGVILNKPTIPAAQVPSDWNATTGVTRILNKPTLATVATTGSYNDLTDKPNIGADQTNADWNATSGVAVILNKPILATVATTGNYTDLLNTPTIPDAQIQSDWNQLNTSARDFIKNKPIIPAAPVNADWNATTGLAQILNKPNLALVATSGSYLDLNNRPALATVATSGSYNDLSNKPTIPAAQVNSDWNATSGVTQILNKPILATVATSGNYNDLLNRPTALTTQRTAISYTTSSGLTPEAYEYADITAFRSYGLLRIQTSVAAWVTVYTDTTNRENDLTRIETIDPGPGSGVVAEVITTGINSAQVISPIVFGFNNESVPVPQIYLKIVNKTAVTTAVTVTLTLLQLEA